MARELNCSACGARVSAGTQLCAGCGLPLMAQAVPAVFVTGPRFSLGAIAAVAVVVALILCYAGSALQGAQKQKADAAFIADVQASGPLSTAQAFEARCGNATDTKTTANGIQIHYGANDLVVTFAPASAPAFAQRVSFRNDAGKRESFDRPEDAQYALRYLNCAAAGVSK